MYVPATNCIVKGCDELVDKFKNTSRLRPKHRILQPTLHHIKTPFPLLAGSRLLPPRTWCSPGDNCGTHSFAPAGRLNLKLPSTYTAIGSIVMFSKQWPPKLFSWQGSWVSSFWQERKKHSAGSTKIIFFIVKVFRMK